MVGTSDPGNPDSISDQQLNRWHDEGIIDWWGWQADMPGVYAKLHTLAFPTRYAEGVPTVLLEAGASKRALIASDTPPCQEVIEG